MTKILAFWGAPGAGKSSAAFYITAQMKKEGINVEMVPEFPKELAWSGDVSRMDDQLYIFAEQNRRLYSLQGKVDWIVTDIALPITIPYLMLPERCSKWERDHQTINEWKNRIADVILDTWELYDTVDVFIKRDISYDPNGRFETKDQSDVIEKNIFAQFKQFGKNQIITTTSLYVNDVPRALKMSGSYK